MAIKLNQSLKQTQNMLMTPQLQQAIKLLTLTHMELADVISQEMVENPMLEEHGTESSFDEIKKENDEGREAKQEDFAGPEIVEGAKDNFDWDSYVDSFNSSSSSPPGVLERQSKEDAMNYENMVTQGQTLAEHLEWQLRMADLSSKEMHLAEKIIHNINDDGYLEDTLENIMQGIDISLREALEVLEKIHQLDPLGCGARSLEECLLIQVRSAGYTTPLIEKIINFHLEDLKSRNYTKLKESLLAEKEHILFAESVIQNLIPKPGRLISSDQVQYVVPDIYIKEIAGEYVVALNNEGVPKLRISNLYKDLVKKKPHSTQAQTETKEYVQDKLRSAMWLIKSIENRQKTIYKVAEAIIRYQKEFFKRGPTCLKPMILKDIAQEIGVHESTVSRVTTNKFVHTPLGVFELKYFFNVGIGAKNGGLDTTSETLKLKIKHLIQQEDPKKPLSDQKIVNILKHDGTIVARRTVTKYREGLEIGSSAQRKK